MSDTNTKPSLPPPRRQPAAPAVKKATMEDNIAIRKTKEVKFGFEHIVDKIEVEAMCEFDNKLPVNIRKKKTLQSDRNGRQPAVQEIKEDILTPPSAPLVWPHPELTEQ